MRTMIVGEMTEYTIGLDPAGGRAIYRGDKS